MPRWPDRRALAHTEESRSTALLLPSPAVLAGGQPQPTPLSRAIPWRARLRVERPAPAERRFLPVASRPSTQGDRTVQSTPATARGYQRTRIIAPTSARLPLHRRTYAQAL